MLRRGACECASFFATLAVVIVEHSMQKILEFLWKNRDVALATIGYDDRPKVRVFQIMTIKDNKLYFATGPHKKVYDELQQNPAVEILAYKGNISVRITGNASFKVDSFTQMGIYQGSDILKRLYRSALDLAYFSVSIDSLDYYDLSTNPPTFRHYDGTTGEFQSLNPFGKH